MLFQMLSDYIEHKLYTSIDEVHEKIVVYHASGKITDGEFLALFDMLFPTVVQEETDEDSIMTIETFKGRTVSTETEVAYPMPLVAVELIGKMIKAHKLEGVQGKLDMYMSTGQLSSEQCEQMLVQEDTPTVLPELDEGLEE